MKTVTYSEENLASLISEVEKKFSKHLEKAESEQEETLEKNEEVSASAESETVEEIQKSEEKVKEESISFDYSDEDITEMNEMYASMTKAEKEAHYQSIKKTLFGSEEVVEEKIEKTEEVPVEKVTKSEEAVDIKATELAEKLEKSEAKYEDLQKNFQDLLAKLSGYVKKGQSAPKQKAITRLEYIAKSEEDSKVEKTEEKEDVSNLEKSEITKRLSVKARDPKLAKADREAINNYCLEQKTDIESIRHLL